MFSLAADHCNGQLDLGWVIHKDTYDIITYELSDQIGRKWMKIVDDGKISSHAASGDSP